jgi:hypothetical protein
MSDTPLNPNYEGLAEILSGIGGGYPEMNKEGTKVTRTWEWDAKAINPGENHPLAENAMDE